MPFRSSSATGYAYGNVVTPAMPTGATTGDRLRIAVTTRRGTGSTCTPTDVGLTLLHLEQNSNASIWIYECDYDPSLTLEFTTDLTANGGGGEYLCAQVLAHSGQSGTNTFVQVTSFTGSSYPSPQTFVYTGGTAAANDDLIIFIGLDTANSDQWTFQGGTCTAGTFTDEPGGYSQNAQTGAQYLDAVAAGATGNISIITEQVLGFSFIQTDAFAIVISAQTSGGGGGGTNTPVAANATQTQTPTRGRVINMHLFTTQTQSTSSAPALANSLPISTTQTQTPVRVRAIGSNKTANETQTASRSRALPFTKTATETQTTSRLRSPGKLLSATETQTTSRVRAIGKISSATETQTITQIRAFARLLSAIHTQTASRTRALSPVAKSATNAETPSLAKGQGHLKTLTANIVQSLAKSHALGIFRNTTNSQTLQASKAESRTLSANASQTLAKSAALGLARSANETQTLVLIKGSGLSKLISATQAQTGALTNIRTLARTLSTAVISQTGALIRSLLKAPSVTNSQTPSRIRLIGLSRSTTTIQTGDQSNSGSGSTSKTLTATQTQAGLQAKALLVSKTLSNLQSLARSLAFGLRRNANETQTPNLVKGAGFFKTLSATHTQTMAHARAIATALSTAVAQTPQVSRAFVGFKTFLATASQTSSKSATFNLKRNATETQTITFIKGSGLFKFLNATQTQTQNNQRNVGLVRSGFATQFLSSPQRVFGLIRVAAHLLAPQMTRALPRTASVTTAQTPSLSKGQGRLKTLAANIVQAATRVTNFARAIAGFQSQISSNTRAFQRTLSITEVQSATLARAIAHYISVTSSQQASEQHTSGTHVDKALIGAHSQTAYVGRGIGHEALALQTQFPSLAYTVHRASGVVTSITIDPASLPARATIRIIIP